MPNTLLRTRIRKERKALTAKQRANFAFMASLHLPKLLPHLPKNAKIGPYLDDFGELPTAPILAFCQKHGFTPFLPITIKNKPLRFAPVVLPLAKTPLKRHRLGMQEPFVKYGISADKLDMIICPLVAVDRQGNRLGMGADFMTVPLLTFVGLR
ncbi:5-formyltetrahydrofolate cyclo-ligase [Moraxella bovis]|nr:5-formyltetrahydrofolate cyclo-ligase [Moraxella bovis]UZA30972.1 5-formyltetrahydrofolate cyclo-ligase [Moraxella bovis]